MRSPRPTRVAGLSTTMPAFFRAISARKKPMPAEMPKRRDMGMLLMIHSRIRNRLSRKKIRARQEHRTQRDLPAVAHAIDHGKREIGVQAHTRCQGDRVVGQQAHDQGADGRGQAGRDEYGAVIHAGSGQDLRVDHNNVGHGQEGGNTSQHFTLYRGAVVMSAQTVSLAWDFWPRSDCGSVCGSARPEHAISLVEKTANSTGRGSVGKSSVSRDYRDGPVAGGYRNFTASRRNATINSKPSHRASAMDPSTGSHTGNKASTRRRQPRRRSGPCGK